VIAVLALVGSAGCGGDDSPEAEDARAESAPLVKEDLNLRRGTWRGVGIGSTRRQVIRRLGRIKQGDPFAPLGADSFDVGAPPTPRNPPGTGLGQVWRGRNFVMTADRGRAWILLVSARGTKTGKGVGVGDSLADVKKAYPKLRCGTANEGAEWPEVEYCQGPVARGRRVWFGGDPVQSVTVSKAPLR